MAKSTRKSTTSRRVKPVVKFDTEKFENVLQIGGIQTASLESPPGSGQMRRVALVNTGSPLRFTVSLDRGCDIVEAFYNQHSLAYLTINGIKAPSHAHHSGLEWLYGFPGGLVTTCGPQYIGPPREEDGQQVGLHGHHSNLPAALEMLINPDPHRGRNEMLLTATVRDTRMFEPNIETRRTIACTLGAAEIRIFDELTNRGNTTCAHNWLYHVNLGYPLVDKDARLIYAGKTQYLQAPPVQGKGPSDAQLNRMKRVAGPLEEHVGTGERCLVVEVEGDRSGNGHVGLVNHKLGLGLELVYPTEALPRIVNWQHFAPRGSYVTAVEPFSGSLVGKAQDDHPKAEQYLKPGQTKRYQLTIKVHDNAAAIREFARHDGNVWQK